jgi:membrane fusion protein, copper/silver efflux system
MSKNKKIIVIFSTAVVVLTALFLVFSLLLDKNSDGLSDSGELEYYCPMHPQIQSKHPGVCPICNMDLIKKGSGETMEGVEEYEFDASIGELVLSPTQQVLANVQTMKVSLRNAVVTNEVNGYVKERDDAYRIISSPIKGKLTRLFIRYENQFIRKGQTAFEIYSPELISTQREYLLAYQNYENFRNSPYSRVAENAEMNLQAARNRLKLWFLSDSQIDQLERNGTIKNSISYSAEYGGIVTRKFMNEGAWANDGESIAEVVDLSSVWVIANFYEYEASRIRIGMPVEIKLSGYERSIRGKIDYINPFVDPDTRTLEARITVSNPGLMMKPGMYVRVSIGSQQVTSQIIVPKSAVLRLGKKDVVYIKKSENIFRPVNVKIGGEIPDGFIIASGLNAGDEIVVSGGYLIDSESQLKTGSQTDEHFHGNEEELKINKDQDIFKDLNHKH